MQGKIIQKKAPRPIVMVIDIVLVVVVIDEYNNDPWFNCLKWTKPIQWIQVNSTHIFSKKKLWCGTQMRSGFECINGISIWYCDILKPWTDHFLFHIHCAYSKVNALNLDNLCFHFGPPFTNTKRSDCRRTIQQWMVNFQCQFFDS